MNTNDSRTTLIRSAVARSAAALQAFSAADVIAGPPEQLGAASQYALCAADVALRSGGFRARTTMLELRIAARARDQDGTELVPEQQRPSLLAVLTVVGIVARGRPADERHVLTEAIRADFDRRWPGTLSAEEAQTWVDGIGDLIGENPPSPLFRALATSTRQTDALLHAPEDDATANDMLASDFDAERIALFAQVGEALVSGPFTPNTRPRPLPVYRRVEVSLSPRTELSS